MFEARKLATLLDGRRLLPLLAVGLWLFCVVQYALRPGRMPAEQDYRSLAAQLDREVGERDAVAIAPHWAERGLLHFGQHRVLGVRDLVGEDLSRFGRLFLVGVFEEDAGPVREALARRYRLEHSERFGRLTLDRFALPAPGVVLFDFWEEIDRAEVRVEGEKTERCDRWERQRWTCPGPDWHFVGQLVTDMDYSPRRCLWAHPVSGGPLRVEFRDVPIGSAIVGRHGIRRTGVGRNASPVVLEVEVDGESVGRFEAADRLGYFAFEADTRALAGQRRTVRFSVSARNVGTRHYCFEARSIAGSGGGSGD